MILLLFSFSAYSQNQVTVTDGSIKGDTGEYVIETIIMAYDSLSTLLAYSQPSVEGKYSLKVNRENLRNIQVSHLAFERENLIFDTDDPKLEYHIDFVLSVSSQMFDELEVIAEY